MEFMSFKEAEKIIRKDITKAIACERNKNSFYVIKDRELKYLYNGVYFNPTPDFNHNDYYIIERKDGMNLLEALKVIEKDRTKATREKTWKIDYIFFKGMNLKYWNHAKKEEIDFLIKSYNLNANYIIIDRVDLLKEKENIKNELDSLEERIKKLKKSL